MFSALGNIFSIKPRQAEQSDTRQGIQRHDPEFEQRNKNKKPKKNNDLELGNATVSVTALQVFLENFIKNGAEEQEQSANAHESNETGESEEASPITQTETPPYKKSEPNKTSSAAAHAAAKYQNAADTNERASVLLETTDAAQGPSLDLSSADIRTVYTLIGDLKELSEHKIEYLNIERADSFLESLINAVNKIKTALNR